MQSDLLLDIAASARKAITALTESPGRYWDARGGWLLPDSLE